MTARWVHGPRAWLRKAKIRTKVIFIIMTIVLLVLSLTGLALIPSDIAKEKRRLVERVQALAEIISSNSTAALVFRDNATLAELLASVRRRSNIELACIYDATSKVASSFHRENGLQVVCPASPGEGSSGFREGRLWVWEPIVLDKVPIGRLLIVSDLREMRERIRFGIFITALVLLLGALIAFVVSRRLERLVSEPVRELAVIARNISEKQDYSMRARISREDEFGDLIDAFNHLLARTEQANQEHEQLLQEAREAVRIREDFISVASHELKTPITPLKLQVQLIHKIMKQRQDSAKGGEKARFLKMLDSSERQIERLSGLIDDLLDVSRISSGNLVLNPEDLDLAVLLREIIERFQPEIINSRSAVSVEVDGQVRGYWDRARIEQIVINLLTNALRYGGGSPIRIVASLSGDSAILKVEDHGIGIAPEDHHKIFERFERAVSARHYGGLGLGLYICREIVQAHQGEIRLESVPGQGATFIVQLPLHAAIGQAEARPA